MRGAAPPRRRWLRELGLLARQLTAHDAFVLRRALREGLALGLARTGRVLPGAAALAARVHPGSARAQAVLADRAEQRGDPGAAEHHRRERDRLTRNTAETSVLDTLRNTLAWRSTRRRHGGVPPELERCIAEGRLAEAEKALDAWSATPGSRLDVALRIAQEARRRGDEVRAAALLEHAGRADPGRADVWRALGELAQAAGHREDARDALERSVALDAHDAHAWLALGDARAACDAPGASEAWQEALTRDPNLDAALLRLEAAAAGARAGTSGAAPPPALRVASPEQSLRLGDESRVEITAEGAEALWVLEPFGGGVLCEPRGRVPLASGATRVELRLRAQRPHAVNAQRPWSVELAVVAHGLLARARIAVRVPDAEPGQVYAMVTEDHELYDERESFDAELARTTLVSKSRLAEEIANRTGAAWTHTVDVASLALVEWAAAQSRGDVWRDVERECREHLVDAVAAGNDLALHCHAFHDPASPGFCHAFDADADRVTTQAAFLETPLPGRGFWSRAFPHLGDVEDPVSRAGATWRGIGRLEALGRLGDPRFRVTLFRAGSFDFGEDAAERARSLGLLERLGLLADSDVPKPRLYHRPPRPSAYPVDGDLRAPADAAARVRLLEIRPEFNVEADFLSDLHVLNRYVDGRVADAAGEPGVHVICAMTHDKFINWRMGRRWDSLDPDYGDWRTIRAHLRHVGEQHPAVHRTRARDAILEWWERYAPALVAWRDEEIVVLARPGAERETFRYAIRLLGRGIAVDAERPQRVAVHLPAWLHGRIRDAWIERGGARIPSHALAAGPPRLAFLVDDRSAAHELVVVADAGDGISAQPDATRPHRLELRSRHPYRRATLEVPAELAPDRAPRRLREVALAASGDAFEAELALEDPA